MYLYLGGWEDEGLEWERPLARACTSPPTVVLLPQQFSSSSSPTPTAEEPSVSHLHWTQTNTCPRPRYCPHVFVFVFQSSCICVYVCICIWEDVPPPAELQLTPVSSLAVSSFCRIESFSFGRESEPAVLDTLPLPLVSYHPCSYLCWWARQIPEISYWCTVLNNVAFFDVLHISSDREHILGNKIESIHSCFMWQYGWLI